MRRLILVWSLFLAVVLPTGLAHAAPRIGGGSISGTVTDALTHQPLAGICVHASANASGFVGESDDRGAYTIGNLPPGDYRVQFVDCSARHYVGGTYPSAVHVAGVDVRTPSAVPVTERVMVADSVEGIDQGLEQGGAIQGYATDPNGGQTTPGLEVWLWRADSLRGEYGTNINCCAGIWGLDHLPAGTYYVHYVDSNQTRTYLDSWYEHVLDRASATAVTVTAGTTVTLHDTLFRAV